MSVGHTSTPRPAHPAHTVRLQPAGERRPPRRTGRTSHVTLPVSGRIQGLGRNGSSLGPQWGKGKVCHKQAIFCTLNESKKDFVNLHWSIDGGFIQSRRMRGSRPNSESSIVFLTVDTFCYRAMLCIRGTSHGPLSVRLSVRPSQVGVLLKRLNVGSRKQHHTIPQGI